MCNLGAHTGTLSVSARPYLPPCPAPGSSLSIQAHRDQSALPAACCWLARERAEMRVLGLLAAGGDSAREIFWHAERKTHARPRRTASSDAKSRRQAKAQSHFEGFRHWP
eukprot:scaffold5907_cov120-Isochrysis_galbana.AAC.16